MTTDGAPNARPRPAERPARSEENTPDVAGYVLLRKLAAGGMATVWLAQRVGSERLSVIKLLHPHLAKDPVVSSRFLREAAVASELDHPGIARLSDAGRQGEIFYLAVDFIAGQDLESMIVKLSREGKMLPPALSLTVAQEVLAALDYAHEYRDSEGTHLAIVHRDLSPRNVMLSFDGTVKIIDFGLARTNLGSFRTAPGMVLGTLRYMSPEQAVAEPVDRRSDLYSFTVMLYEMLTGRPLVRGDTPSDILRSVVTVNPTPISQANPALPPTLDVVFAKALEKDRDARYPRAELLRQALLAAAPDLCTTRPEDMGDFVAALFPDEQQRTRDWMDEAAAGEHTHESTRLSDAPEFIPTRMAAAGDITKVAPSPEADLTRLVDPALESTRATEVIDGRSRPSEAHVGSVHPPRPPIKGVALAASLTALAITVLGATLFMSRVTAPPENILLHEESGVSLNPAVAPRASASVVSQKNSGPVPPSKDVTSRDIPRVPRGSAEPRNHGKPAGQSRGPSNVGTSAAQNTKPPTRAQPPAAEVETSRQKTDHRDLSAERDAAPREAPLRRLEARIRAAASEKDVQKIIDGASLQKSTRDCMERWIYISFNREKVSACLDLEAKKP